MNKKICFALIAVIAVVFVCILSGAAIKPVSFAVSVVADEKVVFNKTYKTAPSVALVARLFYDGNPRNMLKKRFKGDVALFSDTVNPEIANDLKTLAKSLSYPAVEPNILYEGKGKFVFREGKNGRTCDYEQTLRQAAENEKCAAVFETTHPVFTVEELRKNTVAAGKAKTAYYTSGRARKNNVELAASRLDGQVVLPNEKLSFNEIVGKRTAENGFSEAKVILYGEYTGGIGGGVCQVSTTLYNAWLKAGLDAEKSRPHSLEPSYVTPGLDAMVSEENDLVLTNNTSFPVYIGAFYDGSYVEFVVYTRSLPCTIKLASEFVRALPCDEYEIVPGETEQLLSLPKNGAIYRSYREFIVDGEVIVRESLRTSTYLPQKGKIAKRITEN